MRSCGQSAWATLSVNPEVLRTGVEGVVPPRRRASESLMIGPVRTRARCRGKADEDLLDVERR